MAEAAAAAPPATDYRAEITHLSRDLLPTMLLAVALLAWVWFGLTLMRGWPLDLNVPAATIPLVAVYVIHRLGLRRYGLAAWLLLGSLILSNGFLVAAHPASGVIFFGVVFIIVANTLLGAWQALLVGGLTWACNAIVLSGVFGPEAMATDLLGDALVLFALTVGAVWLSARPLRRSVDVAMEGWVEAHKALDEVRDHRAELYRVMRTLDIAYHRIERMNTELIARRAEAERARAQKATFVTTVSHELRGPLNLILGFSRLMALSPESYSHPLPVPYRADVDAIYRNSQHLTALVDDILALSEIETERLPLVKDRVDLEGDVIRRAVDGLIPLLERKGLYLHLELAGNLPWILADPIRLRQALLNLLLNALRLTERGGITIRTAHLENRILVTVQDTGPGIAAADMPKLFREFSQLHRTPTREGRGSGLGLAICKQLIELHGGEIWAQSEVGQGTTFNISLPIRRSDARLDDPLIYRPAHAPATGQPVCVVVHDDPATIRLLARHLEGYRVVGVADPQEIGPLVAQLYPRAILTTERQAQGVRAGLAALPYDVPLVTCELPPPEQAAITNVLSYLVKPVTPEMVAAVMSRVEKDEGETVVLLVDDDPDAVRLQERLLKVMQRPYRILKAYSGYQAVARVADVVPDIIFLDLVMPELDGWQTLDLLRADVRLEHVPVVIISAQDQADEARAIRLPLTIYSQTPLDIARAARCVQALLEEITPGYLPEQEPDGRTGEDRPG